MFEAQTRGCLHFHGLFWGSIPSALFQYASDKPELCKKLADVVDSSVQAFVNQYIHLYRLQLTALQKAKRAIECNDYNNSHNSSNKEDGEKLDDYRGTIMNLDNLALFDFAHMGSKDYPYLAEVEICRDIFRNVQFSEIQINEMMKDLKSLFDIHVQLSASSCNFHKHTFTCHKGKYFINL